MILLQSIGLASMTVYFKNNQHNTKQNEVWPDLILFLTLRFPFKAAKDFLGTEKEIAKEKITRIKIYQSHFSPARAFLHFQRRSHRDLNARSLHRRLDRLCWRPEAKAEECLDITKKEKM